jgi:hypothetical protein
MFPNANIGISMDAANLVGIDVDPRKNGEETIEQIARGHAFPRTPTACTGSGGLHFYFAGRVRSGNDLLGSGVDVKSTGGYLVAPPSLHGLGRRYSWLVWDEEPPPLPDWLTPPEKVRKPLGENVLPVGEPYGGPYAVGALRREAVAARDRHDGEHRRDELFTAGLRLSRFVLSGDLTFGQVLEVLAEAGVESGLTREVAEAHARNGLRLGIDKGAAA